MGSKTVWFNRASNLQIQPSNYKACIIKYNKRAFYDPEQKFVRIIFR